MDPNVNPFANGDGNANNSAPTPPPAPPTQPIQPGQLSQPAKKSHLGLILGLVGGGIAVIVAVVLVLVLVVFAGPSQADYANAASLTKKFNSLNNISECKSMKSYYSDFSYGSSSNISSADLSGLNNSWKDCKKAVNDHLSQIANSPAITRDQDAKTKFDAVQKAWNDATPKLDSIFDLITKLLPVMQDGYQLATAMSNASSYSISSMSDLASTLSGLQTNLKSMISELKGTKFDNTKVQDWADDLTDKSQTLSNAIDQFQTSQNNANGMAAITALENWYSAFSDTPTDAVDTDALNDASDKLDDATESLYNYLSTQANK
jgi:uncharacterized protein YukE